MWKLLESIKNNLVYLIPLSMLSGLVYGNFFDAAGLKILIIPVTFLMVYPMLVTINYYSLLKDQNPKLQIITQLINFVIIPILALIISMIFFNNNILEQSLWAVGLFFIGILPTSGMTISWTGFAKGNKTAAKGMVVFGLIVGSVAVPLYTKLFMGKNIEFDVLHMFRQIMIFVFLPMAAGFFTSKICIKVFGKNKWDSSIKDKFPPISAIGVVLLSFLAISLKAKTLVQNPYSILQILAPVIIFYLINYLLLTFIGKLLFKKKDAIAMLFGVVMRDLSIALAISMTTFGKKGAVIAIIISLAYVIQIQSAAWYIKIMEKLEL